MPSLEFQGSIWSSSVSSIPELPRNDQQLAGGAKQAPPAAPMPIPQQAAAQRADFTASAVVADELAPALCFLVTLQTALLLTALRPIGRWQRDASQSVSAKQCDYGT